MGFSWVLQARARVPKKKLDAFRETVVDPSKYEWPDSWGAPNEDESWKVAAVVDMLASHADAKKVVWLADGFDALALFSNDSSIWLDMRSHVVAAVLACAALGGEGAIDVTGYIDGGPSDVYRGVADKNGTTEIDVLTSRQATPVADRIHEAVEPLVEELLEDLKSKQKDARFPKEIASVHARTCAALRKVDGAAVVAAIARAHTMIEISNRWATLEKHFPKPAELIDAIEKGWKKIDVVTARKLPTIALTALAEIDEDAARPIGADAAKLKATKQDVRAFVAPLAAYARAMTTTTRDDKSVDAALRAMRKALPKAPHFSLHHQLEKIPAVAALLGKPSAALRDATRKELFAITGKPGATLRTANDDGQVYEYALTLLLAACGDESDRAHLHRVWTDSRGFMLTDHGRLMRTSSGKAYMASLFGRRSKSHYENGEQALALKVLYELDEARAIATAQKLAQKTLHESHDWALSQLFEDVLARDGAKPKWIPVLETLSRQTGDAGSAALLLLARWKRKGAAARVVERLAAGHYDVEQACTIFDATKDPAARKPLEAWMKTLPKNDKRALNRVQQTLARLTK